MGRRPKIPQDRVQAITTKSRRVCAMCWGLERDGRAKEGQIAHLNKKREDNRESNLCWLCLVHHNRYDGKFKQTRGFSDKELRLYKDEVQKEVLAERLPANDRSGAGLLSATVTKAAVLNAESDSHIRLEAWLRVWNQGALPSGIRAASLWVESQDLDAILPDEPRLHRIADIETALHEPGDKQAPRRRTELHASGEYLILDPQQLVNPGQMRWWAVAFDLSGKPLWGPDRWRAEPAPDLSLLLEPVMGPDLQLELSSIELHEDDLTLQACGAFAEMDYGPDQSSRIFRSSGEGPLFPRQGKI